MGSQKALQAGSEDSGCLSPFGCGESQFLEEKYRGELAASPRHPTPRPVYPHSSRSCMPQALQEALGGCVIERGQGAAMVYSPSVMLVTSCDDRWVSSMPAGLGMLHLGGTSTRRRRRKPADSLLSSIVVLLCFVFVFKVARVQPDLAVKLGRTKQIALWFF